LIFEEYKSDINLSIYPFMLKSKKLIRKASVYFFNRLQHSVDLYHILR